MTLRCKAPGIIIFVISWLPLLRFGWLMCHWTGNFNLQLQAAVCHVYFVHFLLAIGKNRRKFEYLGEQVIGFSLLLPSSVLVVPRFVRKMKFVVFLMLLSLTSVLANDVIHNVIVAGWRHHHDVTLQSPRNHKIRDILATASWILVIDVSFGRKLYPLQLMTAVPLSSTSFFCFCGKIALWLLKM